MIKSWPIAITNAYGINPHNPESYRPSVSFFDTISNDLLVVNNEDAVIDRPARGWGGEVPTLTGHSLRGFSGQTLASTTGICWSPELRLFIVVFIVAYGQSYAATSSDGIYWELAEGGANKNWNSVCYSRELGLFVAVGESGSGQRVMTSPDGRVWTLRNSAADLTWKDVCWSPELGRFVAVSSTGTSTKAMYSSNGINWALGSLEIGAGWSSVCWAPELQIFVAVGTSIVGNNKVAVSSDGISWTTYIDTNSGQNWESVCWSPELGIFVAVAYGTAMRSRDGVSWEQSNIGTFDFTKGWNSYAGVTWVPELGLFVTSNGNGREIAASQDGANWRILSVRGAPMFAYNRPAWSPELRRVAIPMGPNGVTVSNFFS